MRCFIPKDANLVPKEAKCVFKGVIYEVYQWPQLMFDGSYQTFEMLKRPDTVKVLAIKDGQLVILNQEQPGYAAFYDLPGGRHDVEVETELQAGQREMLEETGMVFRNWKLIAASQTSSRIESFLYIYVASDFVKQGAQKLDPGEKIEVMQMDFMDVKRVLTQPETRYLPKELLDPLNSIDDLLSVPEIKAI